VQPRPLPQLLLPLRQKLRLLQEKNNRGFSGFKKISRIFTILLFCIIYNRIKFQIRANLQPR
jgi:hypothetical protein